MSSLVVVGCGSGGGAGSPPGADDNEGGMAGIGAKGGADMGGRAGLDGGAGSFAGQGGGPAGGVGGSAGTPGTAGTNGGNSGSEGGAFGGGGFGGQAPPASASHEHVYTEGARKLSVWIPGGLRTIKGVWVNWKRGAEPWNIGELGDGVTSGDGVSGGSAVQYYHKEWREFLASLGLAVALLDGNQQSDSTGIAGGQFTLMSLNKAAADANVGHPELANVPLIVWGHSKTTVLGASFVNAHPERVAAFIQYHGVDNVARSMVDIAKLKNIPMLLLGGANDNILDPQQTLDMIKAGRSAGAQWGGGVEWGLPHGGGNGALFYVRKSIIFPFLLATINKRLQFSSANVAAIQDIASANGFVGNLSTFEFSAAPSFMGNVADSVWFADGAMMPLWRDYFRTPAQSSQAAEASALAHTLVTVTALDRGVTEGVTGTFSVTRAGDISKSLMVKLNVSGTATTDDYEGLSTEVTIPVGKHHVAVPLVAKRDSRAEGMESVVLSVAADAAYTSIGPSATMLVDDAP